jgi:hypothetical protein
MRNKKWNQTILIALLAGLSVFPLKAQQIVWEKIWGFTADYEEVSKLILSETQTNFLALGKSTRWSQQVGFDFFDSLILQKINQNGDTLFLKRLGNVPVAQIAYLGHKFGNVYQAVIQSPINDNNLPVGYPCILEFTDDGVLLQTKYLTAYPEYRPTSCLKTSDGGLILGGYYNGGLSAPTQMMAIKVNFLNEVEWGGQYFPPVITRGIANRLEPMANGNYLLSGTLGRRIYGFEIDSTGGVVNQKTFYETPSNRMFFNGAANQGFRKSHYSFGYYLDGSNSTVGYFGRHDSSGNKIWGGEIPITNVNDLVINRENSIIVSRNGAQSTISRLTKDSVEIWKIVLGTGLPFKFVNGLCFTEPDTGLVFGYYRQQGGNLGNQFWIAKIAGVGTQYNPATPDDTVSVEERFFRPKDSPILYPNPGTERIQFKKLSQETQVAIYSSTGKKLMEKMIMPDGNLDICLLPPGVYLYHLKMGERVFTGKFLKQ